LTTVAVLAGQPRLSVTALSSSAQALLVAAIAWGAFAFGAVYPWAYWPLVAVILAVGLLSFLAASAAALRPLHLGPLTGALLLFAAAAALQLVPLPFEWLGRASPQAPGLVRALDLSLGAQPARHPLSIAPGLTAIGLMLFASFALLVLGTARLSTLRGARGLAHAVASIGVLLAMAGIIQQPLFSGKIYGFWTPQMTGHPFGPFVNRNHFAGWMVMALPLTLGLLCGGIARGMRHVKPTARDRFLWLSSPEANRLILLACAAALMALALALNTSRSGICATMLAFALTGVVAWRRLGTTARRSIAIGYLAVVTILAGAWAGVDTIAGRFAVANWSEFYGRQGAWADAAGIFQRFPLTGTGLNTYGVATIFYQQHDVAQHYAQAHNDYLQLAAEGGLLLIIPALLCVALFGTAVHKRFKAETSTSSYWVRVGAVTGLAAIALQETVEFSLQMPGNAALFAVLCGIALHGSPEKASRRHEV
jgi:putative inorganic carbon (HCO3(-)) transporter